MKRYVLILIAASVWTYGSEPLDVLAMRGEWETFMAQLQCEMRGGNVWCKTDDGWHTIDNVPLPIPWGIE